MNWHRTLRISLLAVLTAATLTACDRLSGLNPSMAASSPGAGFKGLDITGAEYGKKLLLPDTEGRQRSLEEFKGKVVVIFFGYTQCPDVCPTTLGEVAEVRKRLGADGQRLQAIFVSVDPERDTADVLRAYVRSFGDDNIALRGDTQLTAEMARDFKVFYTKEPGKTPTSYTVNHTAASYLYDPQGRLRVYSRYGSGPDAVLHDVQQLLAGR